MFHPPSDQPTQQVDISLVATPKKYLKVLPRKLVVQSAVVALATTAVLLDSKFVTRRIAKRAE